MTIMTLQERKVFFNGQWPDDECMKEEIKELRDENERLRADAEKYQWLLDRMQVRYESPVNDGDKRAVLCMRIGHGFLDSKKRPESGWTNPKYFDECRSTVDSAIKTAMKEIK